MLLAENVYVMIDSCEMVGSVEKNSKSICIVTYTAVSVSVLNSFITVFCLGNVQLV